MGSLGALISEVDLPMKDCRRIPFALLVLQFYSLFLEFRSPVMIMGRPSISYLSEDFQVLVSEFTVGRSVSPD